MTQFFPMSLLINYLLQPSSRKAVEHQIGKLGTWVTGCQ